MRKRTAGVTRWRHGKVTGTPTTEVEASSPLLGRNPVPGAGSNPRMNTDLPGGRTVGKSIFRNLSKGQTVNQEPMTNGGVRRSTPDQRTSIRMNPDGSTRVDTPRGPTGKETIHIDP